MDRGKASARGKKISGRAHAPTGDLIALGAGKQALPDADTKRSASPQPAAVRKLPVLGERKRDGPSLLLAASAAKKPKLGSSFTPLGRGFGEADRRGSPATVSVVPILDESGISVEPAEMMSKIQEAHDDDDTDQLDALLLGTVKYLRHNRAKPDVLVCLTLMHLAKSTATNAMFRSHTVVTAFCSLLQRDLSIGFKSKGNPIVSVLACNIMITAFADDFNWPIEFVKVYMDDAMGERIWVDHPECRLFVQNITSAFGTRRVSRSSLLPLEGGLGDAGGPGRLGSLGLLSNNSSPQSSRPGSPMNVDDDDTKDSGGSEKEKNTSDLDLDVPPRYHEKMDEVERYVTEVIKEQLTIFKERRPQSDAAWRHLIMLISATCGYTEIRAIAAAKLDQWLQNPKLGQKAQELLMSICVNCTPSDGEVIAILCKLRSVKNKQHLTFYHSCLREVMAQHESNLKMILTHTVYNELSTSRNPNNVSLFATIFQSFPEKAAAMLGDIFHDFLTNKEDYLRALRVMYRETIVRGMRVPLRFREFCFTLLMEKNDSKLNSLEPVYKERYVASVADLTAFAMMVGVSSSVREAHTSILRGEPKNYRLLQDFREMVAEVQSRAVLWIQQVAPKYLEKLKPESQIHWLHKVLFLDSTETYTGKENWPMEPERSVILQILSEVPLREDVLEMVLVIGLTSKLPIQKDIMNCAEMLVRRAALLGEGGLIMEKPSCIDLLMNLASYRIPDDKSFPAGYTPASYAVIGVFWRSCIVLVILSALKPTIIGKVCWKKHPTIRCLMEMVMTNNSAFPPLTLSVDQQELEAFNWKDQQRQNEEREKILEFESYLANHPISAENSLLLPNLILMDPEGQARRPPSDTVKDLMLVNSALRVGIMLCRSRDPDFLMELIECQGTRRSMPWLAELVEQSEGSLDVLPVQCLCEFLLHDGPELLPLTQEGTQDENLVHEHHKQQQKHRKQQLLLQRLQKLVQDADGDSSAMSQVLEYFLQRLNHRHAASRCQAIKGLSMVLSPGEGEGKSGMEASDDPDWKSYNWLLIHLPNVPLFGAVQEQVCRHLGNAIREEMEPKLVSAYILFLSQHAVKLPILPELVNDITYLLSERPNVIKYVMPLSKRTPMQDRTLAAFIALYVCHLESAITNTSNIPWCSDQDMILIHWENSRSAILPNLVVQGMITLLSYGPPSGESHYQTLLDLWILPNGEMPRASLMDTQEEALLLPDILRLQMIRSNHPRLVQAALQELEVQQVLLYVQFFGIPVDNMSRLLTCLDSATELDPQTLEAAIVDKAYVSQLVRVQQMRGAQGGHKFLEVFGTHVPVRSGQKEEVMATEGSSQWSVQTQPVSELSQSLEQMTQTLAQVFDPMSLQDQSTSKLYQTVLQKICVSEDVARVIISSFGRLLLSGDGQKCADTFTQIPARACPVLKLLTTKWPGLHQALAEVIDKVLTMTAGAKSPVVTLMEQFLKDYRQSKQMDTQAPRGQEVTALVHRLQGQGKLEGDQVILGLRELSERSGAELETLVEGYMNDTMRRGQTAEGARVACRVLLDSERGCAMSESAAALFLDWLELLDPEVVSSNAELQQQLLFAQKVMVGEGGRGEAHRRPKLPHLLALLTHQSNWTALHSCLDKLLYRHNHATYDATAVLDFLWACQHIPKLWRGKDHKATPKGDPDDVFKFRPDQILSIVEFILQEAEAAVKDNEVDQEGVTGTVTVQGGQEGADSTVIARVSLLVTCVCEDSQRLRAVVEHLCRDMPASGLQAGPRLTLLQELYLHFPYILAWLPSSLPMSQLQASHLSASKLDAITHRLLTTLGNAVPGKSASQRMQESNYALRKLASHHPLLILRQLSMIGALLRGKTQFTFGEMKHRNYLYLFTHVLGLLQLLQPLIFRKDVSGLPEVLDAFFCLLRAHGRNQKSLGILIFKLVVFLQQYVHHDPQRAVPVLQEKVELLSGISSAFPELSELKSLLAGLTLPRQNRGEEDPVVKEEGTPSISPMKTPSQWTVAQLAPFTRRMTKDCSFEEILEVLTDLDETSKRKLEILEYFESELMRLMSHSNEAVREKVFMLVLRHMEFSPRRASLFVPVFLRCLENEDPGISKSAMANLTEVTLLCQDHAQVILRTAFAVNIRTAVDRDSTIGDTLQLLNLEQPKTQS